MYPWKNFVRSLLQDFLKTNSVLTLYLVILLIHQLPNVSNALYYKCIVEEFGFNSIIVNPTNTQTSFSKVEILRNHVSV